MTTDVDDLLRRTYADVAERTVVTAPGDASVVPIPRPARTGWLRPALAAAALLALVVSGLVLITGRTDDRASDAGDLVHAVPSWVPHLGPEEFMRPMRLTAIESSGSGDSLTWTADAGTVTLRTERPSTVDVADVADVRPTVASAADGSATGSPLRWTERTSLELEVAWTGEVPATEIDAFVRGIVFVTATQWEELTARGGFRDEDRQELSRFRIDADDDFDVRLVGDLHDGLYLEQQSFGFPPATLDRCRVQEVEQATGDGATTKRYVVLAPGQVAAAVVRATGVDHPVTMTPLGPAVDVSVGGLTLERPSWAPEPVCTEVR